MSIRLIGKVAYEIKYDNQEGCGGFYLTEEAYKSLMALQMRTEEIIDKAVCCEVPVAGGASTNAQAGAAPRDEAAGERGRK